MASKIPSLETIKDTVININQASYKVMGDHLALTAELQRAGSNWLEANCGQLELWASPSGESLTEKGIKLASQFIELPLDNHPINIETISDLLPPAGQAAFDLTLMLFGNSPQGAALLGTLPISTATTFLQPRIVGDLNCLSQGDEYQITLSSVHNPRDSWNISGSLTVELWDLNEPYQGGSFCGVQLNSISIGSINGGQSLSLIQLQVPTEKVLNASNLTLMLREWTSCGYITRDYQSVTLPEQPLAAEVSEATPVVSQTEPSATISEAPIKPTKSKTIKAATEPKKRIRKRKNTEEVVSINKGSLEQLAQVKGLSKVTAAAIIESRPYKAVEDLLAVKGIGPKMLAKLESYLKV